jgi:hypothetical protein
MADDKNPNKIQPGETQPGIYHDNPGNQSGKAVDINKPESEQENNVDRTRDRHPPRGADAGLLHHWAVKSDAYDYFREPAVAAVRNARTMRQ